MLSPAGTTFEFWKIDNLKKKFDSGESVWLVTEAGAWRVSGRGTKQTYGNTANPAMVISVCKSHVFSSLKVAAS